VRNEDAHNWGQQEKVLCPRCYYGRHIPPDRATGVKWVDKKKQCMCYPPALCYMRSGTILASERALLGESQHSCRYCGIRVHPFCSKDLDVSLCCGCVFYLTNFEPEDSLCSLAYKLLNTYTRSTGDNTFYGPNDAKPLPFNGDHYAEYHSVCDIQNNERDINHVSVGDSPDNGIDSCNNEEENARLAYRQPADVQEPSEDPNDNICRYVFELSCSLSL